MKIIMVSREITSLIIVLMATLSCSRYTDYEGVEYPENLPRDWENPAVFKINRDAPRAYFIPYASEKEARDNLAGSSSLLSCLPERIGETWQSMNITRDCTLS